MTFLIPLVAWLLLVACARCRGWGWRVSFLAASVVWGGALTLLTELLSLFTALDRPFLAAGWSIVAIALALPLLRAASLPAPPEVPTLARGEGVMVTAIAGILACTCLIAVVSPPNNNDSLTYHMSRVMHWAQQGSVAHFPTNILRQLELNPWAEFAILHFQILSGGDHLANLVQWFSMAGCLIGVSALAGLFGASRRGELLAALLAATLPMAILQSSNTQNDLVVSFWLVCFVFFGLLSQREGSPKWVILMSLSLGLAILTKGTAYLFAFPFALWFLVGDLRRSWREAWPKYLSLALIMLALNLGHFQRNYRLFQNPLHSGTERYSNSYLTPGVVLSNLSRNVALHLLTPSAAANGYLTGALASFHSILGVGLDDPATTWPGTSIAGRILAPHEDSSGNPLHLVLFLLVSALLVGGAHRKWSVPYVAALFAGFLLFCIMLRWQPWHSRLQLPLFVLFSPVAAGVISALGRERTERRLVLLFSLASLPWLLCNVTRPVITLSPLVPGYPPSILATPRRLQYFADGSCDLASYRDAASLIGRQGAQVVGLSSGGNGREYPLWVLTRTDGLRGPRLVHVGVKNVSGSIPGARPRPDVTVSLESAGKACRASIARQAP